MLKFNTNQFKADLKYGEEANFEVIVENPAQDQIVLAANTSCGSCTKAEVQPNPIPSNSEAKIKIKYLSRQGGLGDITKSVRLNWFHEGTNYSDIISLKLNVSRS